MKKFTGYVIGVVIGYKLVCFLVGLVIAHASAIR
jgi:hypothetical protein